MYRDGDTLVLERKDCPACHNPRYPEWRGTSSAIITCPACDGTGRGPRGGRRGCKRCLGDGEAYDNQQRMPCRSCGGDWQDAEAETIYDRMPPELIQALDFRVYRSDRPRTLNEGLLGFGTLSSVTDYGRYKTLTDAELIAKVTNGESISTFGVQALKVVDDDTLRFPDHIGIFCHDQGYSVRPVHNEPEDVADEIGNEREYREGLMLGARLAERGLNGTILAVHK